MFKRAQIFLLIFFGFFFINFSNVFAITFDLLPPEGEFQKGQEIKFTININTEGKSYTSTQVGMSYDTQYLEYVSVSPGNTFSTVSSSPSGAGKIIISGSENSPYSGSGVFAYVIFKLIAQAPGSTDICVLYNPEDTPPNTPPTNVLPSSTPPLSAAPPSVLPRSGILKDFYKSIIIGFIFLAIASINLFL
ncbi:MAG: hypothetical protein KatS3mg092_0374 [Patescibacteria group bacterium]|nr:MAG: hypothetical protein KatS3mg092_0374 [Patescibacteria group bacterium]